MNDHCLQVVYWIRVKRHSVDCRIEYFKLAVNRLIGRRAEPKETKSKWRKMTEWTW